MPNLSLVAIPLVSCGSILLSQLSIRETSSKSLIRQACDNDKLVESLSVFGTHVVSHLSDLEQLELAKAGDAPSHEWSRKSPAMSVQNDPFNFLAGLGLAAVQSSDVYTYERVVNATWKMLDFSLNFKHSSETDYHDIRSQFSAVSMQSLHRLLSAAESERSDTFVVKFIEACERYVHDKIKRGEQIHNSTRNAVGLMVRAGKYLLTKDNSYCSLSPIIAARQAAQKCLDQEPEGLLYEYYAAEFPSFIKRMGKKAIEVKDTEYLYRCFDAFVWMGCSAAKSKNRKAGYEIGKACLHGLSQLGRESRAANLECFWDRCLLLPADHAEKNITDIGSWIPSISDESIRERWCDLLVESLSRLTGKVCTYQITKEEKPNLKIKMTEEDYIFSMSDDGLKRTINYADTKMLKEMELYGMRPTSETEFVRLTGPLICVPTQEEKN